MTKKTSSRPVAILVAACLSAALAPAALGERTEITLLVISDIDNMEGSGARGGFSRAAAVARAERALRDHVLYIHAGDSISPSLMSGIDNGKHIIDLLNMEPPDLFVPGNHEFDFGAEVFEDIVIDELDSDIISANLRDGKGDYVPGIIDSKLYDFDGVKVGVFGLTTAETVYLSSPGDDYFFIDSLEAAEDTADLLREQGADLVVAVAHESVPIDEELLDSGFVDVVLSGHDHDLYVRYNGKALLVEPGSQGDYLVAVDLEVDVTERDGRRRVRWWPNYRVIDTQYRAPASDVEAEVERLKGRLDDEFGKVIGTTATALDTRRASVRGGENAFANLMADAMRDLVGADVGLTNGGGIRADKQYPAGSELTRRDIFSELPFGNAVVMLELTGAQLREALENGLSKVEEKAGRFPHVSGVTLSADLSAAAGSRLTEVMVNGEPLDDEATYTVATNDYMAGGGDGYSSLSEGEVIMAAKDTKLMASAVVDYIVERGSVSPRVEGRMKL